VRKMFWMRGLKFALLAVAAVAAAGAVVMVLWNTLLPGLFSWPVIGFWQALGLLLLSKILFGSLRGGRGPMQWRARMADRWDWMSDEERAKFREGMRHRCNRTVSAQAPSPEAAR
jgi:hypothetical protein